MKMSRIAFMFFLLLVSLVADADDHVRQELKALFAQGEQCYLTDDYIQLNLCSKDYLSLYTTNLTSLGDSADVYYAYYNKMRGAYHYGMSNGKDHNMQESDSCYQQCLKTFMERNSDRNTITVLEELAQLYYKGENYKKSLECLTEVFDYFDEHVFGLDIDTLRPDYYKTLSQLAICNARLGQFEEALRQISEAQKYFKKEKSDFYYETLRREGKILMLRYDHTGSVNWNKVDSCYSLYVNAFQEKMNEELMQMSDSQREQHWLALHDFLFDCYRLEDHASSWLYDLALYAKQFLLDYKKGFKKQYHWRDIKRALPADGCAIEFVQYEGRNSTKLLGALVVTKNCNQPQFVRMVAVSDLKAVKATRDYSIADLLKADGGDAANAVYGDSTIYNRVWTPSLMEAIGDARKVYFAPDGLLHQLAIEYMMPDTLKECYRLTSTRNLIGGIAMAGKKTLVCGGIDYQNADNNAATHAVTRSMPFLAANDADAFRLLKQTNPNICNLPGTEREVDSIYAMRTAVQHEAYQDTLLKGRVVTDELFCEMAARGYEVIHLATHGFFIGIESRGTDLKPVLHDNSMSHSGLVFAGAADCLSNPSFDAAQPDGILTARELAGLSLGDVDLMVLSACHTARGYVTADGVFGIQRGLKEAGVKAMIVSLWSVDDVATCRLMQLFHEELSRDNNIHRAFNMARRRLIKDEIVARRFNAGSMAHSKRKLKMSAPQYADAFILIDAL